jgi:hypothetical protein
MAWLAKPKARSSQRQKRNKQRRGLAASRINYGLQLLTPDRRKLADAEA